MSSVANFMWVFSVKLGYSRNESLPKQGLEQVISENRSTDKMRKKSMRLEKIQ